MSTNKKISECINCFPRESVQPKNNIHIRGAIYFHTLRRRLRLQTLSRVCDVELVSLLSMIVRWQHQSTYLIDT